MLCAMIFGRRLPVILVHSSSVRMQGKIKTCFKVDLLQSSVTFLGLDHFDRMIVDCACLGA